MSWLLNARSNHLDRAIVVLVSQSRHSPLAAVGRVPPSSNIGMLSIDKDWLAVEPVAVKIRDMHDNDGVLTGFVVSNLLLRRRVCRALSTRPLLSKTFTIC
jgi:hypothetical protein